MVSQTKLFGAAEVLIQTAKLALLTTDRTAEMASHYLSLEINEKLCEKKNEDQFNSSGSLNSPTMRTTKSFFQIVRKPKEVGSFF